MRVETALEQMLFITVRIATVNSAGQEGSGTGFLFARTLVGSQPSVFLVTNKHVVDGTKDGTLVFRLSKDGQGAEPDFDRSHAVVISDWRSQWFGHPNPAIDIAIMNVSDVMNDIQRTTGRQVFFRCFTDDLLATPADLHACDALEPIVFIGYPNGIWDSKSLIPISRRGHTATPLEVDFDGLPVFLIDASVFGGSSGSPVILDPSSLNSGRDGGISLGQRKLRLLGVVAKVFYRTDRNEVKSEPIPTHSSGIVDSKQMIDLGVVFKASTVSETIEAFRRASIIRPPARNTLA